MSDYEIQTKKAFTILAFGTGFPDDYSKIPAAKDAWWQTIEADGRWEQLKKLAANDLEFAISEAINGEMCYYSGVESEIELPESESVRMVQFPAGEYLVIAGSADNEKDLFNQLEGATFGNVLPKAIDFAYVGGPNTSVKMGETDSNVNGEI